MKKRAITILLALVMCLSLATPAMATEAVENSAEAMVSPEALFPEGFAPRGPKYHYKTVYTEPQLKTTTQRAYGQPTMGTVLDAGDSITYYSYNAGSVSLNVSCALPAPYSSITIGVSIPIGSISPGSSAVSGISKRVTSHGAYVLYVEKTYSVRGYVTYEAPVGTQDWHYYASSGGIYNNCVQERPFLEKVG